MINYGEFDMMLRDRTYLKSTGTVHQALRDRLKEFPGLEALTDQLNEMSEQEEIFSSIRDFYTLAKVNEILTAEKDAFSSTHTYSATLQGSSDLSQAYLLLARSHRFISLLTAVDPHMLRVAKKQFPDEGKHVSFPSGNSEVVMLKGEIRCRVWHTTPFDDATDMETYQANAVVGEPIILKAGDILRQGDFMSVEYLTHDKGALLLHTQMLSGTSPLDISCDFLTRKLVRACAPEGRFSRYQMIATLMRILEREDAFDAIATLLEEPYHFLRWHAMREMIGLNTERAHPHLLKLAESDPQPAVRRAAQTTLEMVYGVPAKQAA